MSENISHWPRLNKTIEIILQYGPWPACSGAISSILWHLTVWTCVNIQLLMSNRENFHPMSARKPNPDSKVHVANMGPIWGRQDPGGPHVGPMNFAIREKLVSMIFADGLAPNGTRTSVNFMLMESSIDQDFKWRPLFKFKDLLATKMYLWQPNYYVGCFCFSMPYIHACPLFNDAIKSISKCKTAVTPVR